MKKFSFIKMWFEPIFFRFFGSFCERREAQIKFMLNIAFGQKIAVLISPKGRKENGNFINKKKNPRVFVLRPGGCVRLVSLKAQGHIRFQDIPVLPSQDRETSL
jgi:hypothetical protein